MNRVFEIIGVIVLLVAGFAYARQAQAIADNTATEDASAASDSSNWTDGAAQAVDQVNPFAMMEQNTVNADLQETNCQAFLSMIMASEGTAQAVDPFAVCYGYRHTIQDFSDHPAITGEWQGESIANLGPSYAGKISTAAGAFQIIRPTWKGCKAALALPDFSPDSQRAAALYLVRQAGAIELVKAGKFDNAVALCSSEWASLPGANAPGQAMQRLDNLRVEYENAGGSIA